MKRWGTIAVLILLVTGCAVASGMMLSHRRTMPPAHRGREVKARDGSTLVQVEGGEFLMGTNEPTVIFGKPEFVCRVKPFWISKYEVTNRQFARFVDESGYKPQGRWRMYYYAGLDNHPVVCVTWKDAVAYCRWAGLRLPTEAEWEKAARGNDGRKYVWGDDWQPEASNNWNLRRQDRMARMAHLSGVNYFSPPTTTIFPHAVAHGRAGSRQLRAWSVATESERYLDLREQLKHTLQLLHGVAEDVGLTAILQVFRDGVEPLLVFQVEGLHRQLDLRQSRGPRGHAATGRD